VTVLLSDRVVHIQYPGAKPPRLTAGQLLALARGVRNSASLSDTGTWFDATTITG
jgi:hypothetical protein